MRLGFAIAAFLEADVLLLDEVFAVGDESFQRKCFGVIAAFKQRGGTILFVSHDASAVERLCDRAVLLRDGRGRVRRPGPRGDRPLPACARRGHDRGAGARGRRECGTGEARIVGGAARRPATATARDQFLAGEPFGLERRSSTRRRAAPPTLAPRGPRRRRGCSSPRRSSTPPRSAGTARRRPRAASRRARLRRSSSAASSSRSRCSAATGGCSTGCRDARPVPRLPRRRERGLVRLEGTWRRGAKDGSP